MTICDDPDCYGQKPTCTYSLATPGRVRGHHGPTATGGGRQDGRAHAMTTKAQQRAAEQAEAVARLRELFPPGATVQTILRHVSQSGMSRAISVVASDGLDNGAWDVSYLVAAATGDRIDPRHGGIKVGGCGMDMGFHLVYNLSYVLYRDGWPCTGDRCPSNTHVNRPRVPRDGSTVHTDGYALSHRWL